MPRLQRDDWLDAALGFIAEHGVAALKVEVLAAAIGVTKGSFYHHFDNRRALLAAMLERWIGKDTEAVITLVESRAGADDPRAALHALAALTISFDGDDSAEIAIREWAAHDAEAATVVAQVDRRRIAYVADLLTDCGLESSEANRRAHVLYRVVIGEHVWRRHGGAPLDRSALTDFVERLTTP